MLIPKEFDEILDGVKKSLAGKTNPRTKKTYTEDDFYAIATETYKKKYGKTPDGKSEDLLFFTDVIEWKAENENFFVCGFASTTEMDAVNDIVTPNCLEDMAKQLLGKEVKVKLGIEHDWVRTGDPRLLPYAKVEEAKVMKDGNVFKLFVKTKLNKHHPLFPTVWNSIKDGYLDAFSIEYLPIMKWKTIEDGKNIRVLDKVDLSGITYTGRPINQGARMTDVFVKAFASADADAVMDQMLHSEGVPTAAPVQDAKCETKEPIKEGEKMAEEIKPEAKAEAPIDIKAEFDALKKQYAELKAEAEELKKRVEFKAMIKEAIKELKIEEKAFEPKVEEKARSLDNKLAEEKFGTEIKDENALSTKSQIERAFGKPR